MEIRRMYSAYRWSKRLALPALWYTAFEMYGLTLGGPQMLFYSVIHTMPVVVFVVLASMLFFVGWWLQTALALLVAPYRDALGLTGSRVASLLAGLTLHALLLVTYESWSSGNVLRVMLCLAGLVLTVKLTPAMRSSRSSRSSPAVRHL